MSRTAETPHEAAQDFIATVRDLSPLIRSTAAASEKRGRLDEHLVAELKRNRLFRLWIPHTYAGEEMALPAACLVFEAASYEDGATGWTVMIGSGGGLFGATLVPDAAREIFSDPAAVIAGSGMPSGTARQVEGGYRVDGRWRYASGAYHATWFTANTIVHAEGQALQDESGAPIIRAMAFPADAVDIIPAWDVTGMRATASEDFVIRDRYVPAYRSFNVFGQPREKGPLYRYPFMSLTELSVASVSLGVARRALDEWPAIAREKTGLGATASLAEQPYASIRYAEATIAFSSARAFWWEQLTASWDRVASGKELDASEQARVRLAAHNAAAASSRAVDLLRDATGMTGLFVDSDFGRCWRDVHTVSQHVAVAPNVLEPSGRTLLGLPPG